MKTYIVKEENELKIIQVKPEGEDAFRERYGGMVLFSGGQHPEGYKGGELLTVKYAFNGKVYEGIVHGSLGKDAIGKRYFIMLLPDKPAAPLLLEYNPVPDCLEQSSPPATGWKKMPVCNN